MSEDIRIYTSRAYNLTKKNHICIPGVPKKVYIFVQVLLNFETRYVIDYV